MTTKFVFSVHAQVSLDLFIISNEPAVMYAILGACGNDIKLVNSDEKVDIVIPTYGHNLSCEWKVVAPEGRQIKLMLAPGQKQLDVEHAVLTVQSKLKQSTYQLIDSRKGLWPPTTRAMVSKENKLIIHFYGSVMDTNLRLQCELLPGKNQSLLSMKSKLLVDHEFQLWLSTQSMCVITVL